MIRHTFAILCYGKTGDLHLVQRAPGHRQITTTEVYAQVSDGARYSCSQNNVPIAAVVCGGRPRLPR